MVQRGQGLGFTLEAREPIGVMRERLGQDLDGDVSIQLCIARPLHLAHPAFANLRGDFVDAEAASGSEGQDVVDYTGGAAARTGLGRLGLLQAVGQPDLDECLPRHAQAARFLVDLTEEVHGKVSTFTR